MNDGGTVQFLLPLRRFHDCGGIEGMREGRGDESEIMGVCTDRPTDGWDDGRQKRARAVICKVATSGGGGEAHCGLTDTPCFLHFIASRFQICDRYENSKWKIYL